ncbi:MAG: pyridoxal phosphate-dependent aminotransferase [Nocardioidaceae bacterium]
MSSISQSWASQAAQRVESVSLRSGNWHAGKGTVSLAIGEPSFDTPRVVTAALEVALRGGATHYAPQHGLPELRQAVAKTELLHRSLGFDEDNVLVTQGGTAGLASAILGTVSPGDVVALEDPTYSLYADLVALAGGKVTTYRRRPDGDLDDESLSRACSGARLLIVCQPSNPTGAVFSDRDWEIASHVAGANDMLVLADEAYEGLVYDDWNYISILDRTDLADRLLLCRTFSKKFAMTGWRIGYLVAAAHTLRPAAVMHRTFNGAVNTAVQWAAITALTQAHDAVARMRDEFAHRRAVIGAEIADVACLTATAPAGAFYYWCHYAGDNRSSVEVAAAAQRAGVAVRPGQEFGASGRHALRLSFAASVEEIREGMDRLREVFHQT